MCQNDEAAAMWVKICGNTNLEDAALAVDLGADAVGFVFAESKRQVTAAQVAAITRHLSAHVEKVGVFDSHDPDEIARAASTAGLTAVQLHGGLDEPLLEQLAKRLAGATHIIQTLHWTIEGVGGSTTAELADQIARVTQLGLTDWILVDSRVGSATGGTGVPFDWAAARSVFASPPSGVHLVLAGGLRPENLAHAVDQLNPWGADVSSGVEASVGRKDPARMKRFIEIAHGAETP
jgi:phosphoribosylanthranilate isomerase